MINIQCLKTLAFSGLFLAVCALPLSVSAAEHSRNPKAPGDSVVMTRPSNVHGTPERFRDDAGVNVSRIQMNRAKAAQIMNDPAPRIDPAGRASRQSRR